jgi:hypothetical protein
MARLAGPLAAVATGAAVVMSVFSSLNEDLQKGIDYLDQYLQKVDKLSTLGRDMNMNAVETMALSEALNAYGIKEDQQGKMFANIREAQAQGTLQKYEGQGMTAVLDDLIRQYNLALEKKDIERQSLIFKTLGIRGNQMELLGSTGGIGIQQEENLKAYEKDTGKTRKDLNKEIEEGAKLEEKQTREIERQRNLAVLKTSGSNQLAQEIDLITKTTILKESRPANSTLQEGFTTKLEANLFKEKTAVVYNEFLNDSIDVLGKTVKATTETMQKFNTVIKDTNRQRTQNVYDEGMNGTKETKRKNEYGKYGATSDGSLE